MPVTPSQASSTAPKPAELTRAPGFADTFLPDGKAPQAGSAVLRSQRSADTLERLARAGLDDFYRGELARSDRARPARASAARWRSTTCAAHRADSSTPLTLQHSLGTAVQHDAADAGPGVAADPGHARPRSRSRRTDRSSAEFVHACVEATKQAFSMRDRYIADPRYMTRRRRRRLLRAAAFDAQLARESTSARGAVGRHGGRGRATRSGWA